MLLTVLKVKFDLMKIAEEQGRFFNVRLEAKKLGINFEWAMKQRKSFLADTIRTIQEAVTNLLVATLTGTSELEGFLVQGCQDESAKIIANLEMQGRFYKTEDGGGVSAEMIQKAKDYDIRTLLPNPIRGGFALCIAHPDKRPSMGIKNNKVRCFSCGFGGDPIDVYQLLHNANFREAVTFLGN